MSRCRTSSEPCVITSCIHMWTNERKFQKSADTCFPGREQPSCAIPKAFELPEGEVVIERRAGGLLVKPRRGGWEDFFAKPSLDIDMTRLRCAPQRLNELSSSISQLNLVSDVARANDPAGHEHLHSGTEERSPRTLASAAASEAHFCRSWCRPSCGSDSKSQRAPAAIIEARWHASKNFTIVSTAYLRRRPDRSRICKPARRP